MDALAKGLFARRRESELCNSLGAAQVLPCAMDEDYIPMPGYFDELVAGINDLDPRAADFDFLFSNMQSTVRITSFLTAAEKQRLNAMLHIVRTRAQPARNPSK